MTRHALLGGAIVGFTISAGVLVLIGFGVSGVLGVGHIDLMYVLWPSSVLLLTSWRSTAQGVILTIFLVVINCLMYMALAYCMLMCARLVRRLLA